MRGSKGSRLSLCPRAGGIYILIPVLPLPLEAACPGWELGCKLELWCGWACSLEPGHDMARAGLSKWWRMYMLVCSVLSDSLQLYRAHQAPLSMGFSRQEYWSGLPFPPPGDLLHPGIEPVSLVLAGGFFTTAPPGNPWVGWGSRCKGLAVAKGSRSVHSTR